MPICFQSLEHSPVLDFAWYLMYLLAINQPCEAVLLWWSTLSQLPHLVHSTTPLHLITCKCCWTHLGNSTVASKYNSLACFLFPKNIPFLALLWPVTHISPMPTEVWNWIIPYLQHLHPFAHVLSLHPFFQILIFFHCLLSVHLYQDNMIYIYIIIIALEVVTLKNKNRFNITKNTQRGKESCKMFIMPPSEKKM